MLEWFEGWVLVAAQHAEGASLLEPVQVRQRSNEQYNWIEMPNSPEDWVKRSRNRRFQVVPDRIY